MEESKIIKTIGEYHIWFSKGDMMPYWVSDEDGTELISFETEKECKTWIRQEIINSVRK